MSKGQWKDNGEKQYNEDDVKAYYEEFNEREAALNDFIYSDEYWVEKYGPQVKPPTENGGGEMGGEDTGAASRH